MSGASMSPIEILRVPSEELTHDGRNTFFAAFEQDMDMVVHKHPGGHRATSVFDVLTKPFKKAALVFVISEYFRFVDSPHHDVMQSAGDVQSGLAWHGVSLRELVRFVKLIDTRDTTSPSLHDRFLPHQILRCLVLQE